LSNLGPSPKEQGKQNRQISLTSDLSVSHGGGGAKGRLVIWASALRTSNFACIMLRVMYLKADLLSIFIKF